MRFIVMFVTAVCVLFLIISTTFADAEVNICLIALEYITETKKQADQIFFLTIKRQMVGISIFFFSEMNSTLLITSELTNQIA